MTRVGVIADTHGLLRPEALSALAGCDRILHAGDVGKGEILAELQRIGPVTAIRGNIDRDGEAASLPETEAVEIDGLLFYLVHSIADLDLNPAAAQMSAVVCGHSHKASIVWKEGVLYLNPGSAGPRRFKLPISVGIVQITDGQLRPEIVEL